MSNCPYQPVRLDDSGIPVYESWQLEMYGLPDVWGIWKYMVVETRETSWPLVVDYSFGQQCSQRPVHRYVRCERFHTTVIHLTGLGGKVPDEIVEEVENKLDDNDPDSMWYSVQKILRGLGKSRYFNRIAYILEKIGYVKMMDGNVRLDRVFDHFQRMSTKFDHGVFGVRKYFPPLRYVAIRLLHLEGAVFNYRIPAVKTDCKVDGLNRIFNILFS